MIDYKDFILIEDKDGYIYPKYNIYCNNCGVSRGYIKPYKGCEERLCRSCGNKGEMSEMHKENIRKSIKSINTRRYEKLSKGIRRWFYLY